MPKKLKLILFTIIVLSLIPLAGFAFDKIYYFDRVNFISPIELKNGSVPIRHDSRGQGDFAAPRRGRRIHQGIDILAEVGTPVMAVKSGRVYSKNQPRGMGKYIEIVHLDGLVTLYAHLSEVAVKSGQKVKQGAIIGYVGKTGNAQYKNIQAHLHFEIRKNGLKV